MTSSKYLSFCSLLTALGIHASAEGAEIVLTLPVACEVGQTCFIQNYVDHDPSSGARDYACGVETYDGHDGTDFRLPSVAEKRAGVAVLAAADGRVLRTRDRMADISVRAIETDQIKGRECGNGVIVQHANGFESEYCHLARGSVRVRPGDAVRSGQPLGNVGLSGNTEFAHLHFTLRRGGEVVDPFAYEAVAGTCNGGASLWDPALADALIYRMVAILNTGFAAKPVTAQEIEDGDEGPLPGPNALNLIAYVRAIALRAGDMQHLTIFDPQGDKFADHSVAPLQGNKAQYTLMTGRKRPPGGWKPGTYRATYRIVRDGALIVDRTFKFRL
jgi:hypothetical protein